MMPRNEAGTEDNPNGWMRGGVLAGLAAIEAALLYKLIWGQVSANSTELVAAVSLVAVLLLLTGTLESLKSVSFGKEGFKAEIQRLERKTDNLAREVADLTLASMGEDAFRNLKKLARGYFEKYTLEDGIGLHTELYHLRNLGFVKLKEGRPSDVTSIRDIPRSGPDLCDFIEVTEIGHKYIALRRRYHAAVESPETADREPRSSQRGSA